MIVWLDENRRKIECEKNYPTCLVCSDAKGKKREEKIIISKTKQFIFYAVDDVIVLNSMGIPSFIYSTFNIHPIQKVFYYLFIFSLYKMK